jgi:hypothetical protein
VSVAQRFFLAWICFFRILFGKKLPDKAVAFLPEGAQPKALPEPGPERARPVEVEAKRDDKLKLSTAQHHRDGALALLALLQREGRLVDFLR